MPPQGETTTDGPSDAPRSLDRRLLELLVCPLTKTDLLFIEDQQELWSKPAGLAYPIRDGIPIMLPDEARTLTEDERKP
ncbi:MAG: Trm112 family protein [Pseudomonadota bacterium]